METGLIQMVAVFGGGVGYYVDDDGGGLQSYVDSKKAEAGRAASRQSG